MEAAGRIVEDTLNLLSKAACEGMRTIELDEMAAEYIKSRGATASFLNYNGYPKSICTSVNEEVVHGIPGKYRLKDGDILSLDVGAYLDGFHGDAARTVLIGNVPEEVQKLVRVTKECFFARPPFCQSRVPDFRYRKSDSGACGEPRLRSRARTGRSWHRPRYARGSGSAELLGRSSLRSRSKAHSRHDDRRRTHDQPWHPARLQHGRRLDGGHGG